jgi:hypothetical protein
MAVEQVGKNDLNRTQRRIYDLLLTSPYQDRITPSGITEFDSPEIVLEKNDCRIIIADHISDANVSYSDNIAPSDEYHHERKGIIFPLSIFLDAIHQANQNGQLNYSGVADFYHSNYINDELDQDKHLFGNVALRITTPPDHSSVTLEIYKRNNTSDDQPSTDELVATILRH